MSFILPTDVRYDYNTGGWNGYFLPTYAYTASFAYESHDIGFKLTVNITSVNELKENGFSLNQNTNLLNCPGIKTTLRIMSIAAMVPVF